jgi:hypothetical protein
MSKRKSARREPQPSIGIQIGSSPQSVAEYRAAIFEILTAPHADQETKRKALETLKDVCAVNGTTISGCTLSMGAQS